MGHFAGWFRSLERDLGSPLAVRRFGSGWFSGFFAILLAITGLCLVVALRWPGLFATPELAALHGWSGLRPLVHALLIGGYALALLSMLLRPRKAMGIGALVIALVGVLPEFRNTKVSSCKPRGGPEPDRRAPKGCPTPSLHRWRPTRMSCTRSTSRGPAPS